MRYQRSITSGHLSYFDELALSGDITAAAADATGNYLVILYEVYVHGHPQRAC